MVRNVVRYCHQKVSIVIKEKDLLEFIVVRAFFLKNMLIHVCMKAVCPS